MLHKGKEFSWSHSDRLFLVYGGGKARFDDVIYQRGDTGRGEGAVKAQ